MKTGEHLPTTPTVKFLNDNNYWWDNLEVRPCSANDCCCFKRSNGILLPEISRKPHLRRIQLVTLSLKEDTTVDALVYQKEHSSKFATPAVHIKMKMQLVTVFEQLKGKRWKIILQNTVQNLH